MPGSLPGAPTIAGLWDAAIDGPKRPLRTPGPSAPEMFLSSLAALWVLGAVVTFSDARGDVGLTLLMAGSGLMLATAWSWRTASLSRGPERLWTKLDVALWAFVPAAGLLGLALFATDMDLALRIKLSEPELRSLVAEVEAGGPVSFGRNGRPVGLFWLHEGRLHGDAVFLQAPSLVVSDGGLVWSPKGSPPWWSPEVVFRHIVGPWWRYDNNY